MSAPHGVSVAFGSDALNATPTWTRIDDPAGIDVVQGWRIRRGRSYMLDRTEAGTCDADFVDTAGTMDPTNSTGPFYPMDPNCPMAVAMQNPVTSAWSTLYTGLVQQMPQTLDVSAAFSKGTLSAADMFSLLAVDEVPPGLDFDNTDTGSSTANTIGNTTYAEQDVQSRIKAILADAGIPSGLTDIFSGNVIVQACVEPPGSKTLEMLWNAADAEFPGVANFYVSKDGILTFHGRLARFNPTDPTYNINTWHVGDTAAVAAHSSWALISGLTFDRDVAKVINASSFTPDNILDADIPGQLSVDTGSIATYGNRAYSGDNLLTAGPTSGASYADALTETKKFSDYYKDNFHDAQTRISQLEFRWVPVGAANDAAQWAFLCGVEISDRVMVTTTHPGGGGFSAEPYFVEGVTYDAKPSGTAIPDVTLTVDLSPAAYFSTNPF